MKPQIIKKLKENGLSYELSCQITPLLVTLSNGCRISENGLNMLLYYSAVRNVLSEIIGFDLNDLSKSKCKEAVEIYRAKVLDVKNKERRMQYKV